MVEQLKRPSNSLRNSRKRRLRSPSPMPPQTTPTDAGKPKAHKVSTPIKPDEERVKNTNSTPNATPFVAMTMDDVEVVEIDSSSSSQTNEPSDEMDIDLFSDAFNGSEKDLLISDPVVLQVDPLGEKVSKSQDPSLQNEFIPNQKDNLLSINRKRTPSPTSFSPPPPKRLHRDKNIENLSKVNIKSTSPSPLIAPPIRSSGLLSSASQVLNEEFKRKQMTDNLKIKQLITKEIRKHSKSKCLRDSEIGMVL